MAAIAAMAQTGNGKLIKKKELSRKEKRRSEEEQDYDLLKRLGYIKHDLRADKNGKKYRS